MVTMKDIADKAGVSLMTVSNVINGNTKRVSIKTATKIQQLIKEMNYIPNIGAQSLASKRSRLVSIVCLIPDLKAWNFMKEPFISELIGSLEGQIHEYGYYMLVYFAKDVAEIVAVANTWNVEGMIVLFTKPSESRFLRDSIKKSIVFIDCYFDENDQDLVNVGFDDQHGGYLAAQYLLEMGHRDITFVANGPELRGADYYRNLGFQQAIRDKNLPVSDKNLYQLPSHHGLCNSKWEQELLEHRTYYSALFFTSDLLATDAMNYFQDHGLLIPRDISIIGFDDNVFATLVRPKLTTVHQDVSEKVSIAIQQLATLIETGSVKSNEHRLQAKLIIRDSVRDLRDKPQKSAESVNNESNSINPETLVERERCLPDLSPKLL